ncbi:MAG: class I SAM-dependent methyltransferase [Candidatus Marinimicrobia bacterium]|nr:class I SAM-dependent methyltransferase [Candidatus Neomarinimicrobiota bacterium]
MIKDIYSNPELYDLAHWWKTNDIEFIADSADTYGSPVLEMAAGTGRLAVPILKRGYTYTGIELSPDFVKCAQKKLKSFQDQANVLKGDIRNFDLGKKFQFIFIGFNSIFHLLTNGDIESFLKCVRAHLADSGTFLIDTFIPDPFFLFRDKQKYYVMEFDYPNGDHCIVSETNDYDNETQINHIHWYFNTDGKDKPDEYRFDMHMIFPDTMDRLLSEAGFVIKEKYGDYDKTPFGPESNLQIYLCGK